MVRPPTFSRHRLAPVLVGSTLAATVLTLVVAGGVRSAPATSPPSPAAEVALRVACNAPVRRIDPAIYGIGYYPLTDAKDGYLWALSPGARRFGGNHTSRYNWRLGNAWNTADDWFFRNVDYTGRPGFSWEDFLRDNRRHRVGTALTIPIMGWVAKDTRSVGFPTASYPLQQRTDPDHPYAGNGRGLDGQLLPPGPPERTSVRFGPEDAAAWVKAIRAFDAREGGGRSVNVYILDNEPMLWHKTHRDVHPSPTGYDELRDRTIAYARAIRRADPGARIAGGALWGWPAYFFSAKDQEAGFRSKPDRRAHGDVPLLAWLLREVAEEEKRTGEHLLDLVDVHWYPQDLAKDGEDRALWERRLRATRSLWDGSFRDESWIDEQVRLLPRMAEIIAENHPGLGLQLGEYNFGGERDMSGAMALAEALGRFGQAPNLSGAYYWTYPPPGSPAAAAFRAFRSYDGKGARFLDLGVPTEAPQGTSLFASRDATGRRLVLVALNHDTRHARDARVVLDGCPGVTGTRGFVYAKGGPDLAPTAVTMGRDGAPRVSMSAFSITVIELTTTAVARGQ